MKVNNFKFGGEGLERFFGTLEAKIMDELWNVGKEATIKEIQQRIGREKAVSFNATMTVMNRLVDKGVLRRRPDGRSYVYEPVLTREQFLDAQSKELAFDLVKEFGSFAVTHMVDAIEQADPELLEQLERKLIQMKKDR